LTVLRSEGPDGKHAHRRRLVRRIPLYWPEHDITIRGDRHNGRREAMDWCRRNGVRYVFGLPVNAALDPQDLRQDHAWEQRL
jgi:Transposase DDE domain group 1